MRNVYIVGPSCAGKTSLLHYLKREAGDRYSFPIRVVSRPPRTKDDELENAFLSHEAFEARRGSTEFFVSWYRFLGENRKEYYAFRDIDVSTEKTNVFSANNAFLLYPESRIPRDIFETHDSVIIACIAPDEVRMRRLKERSPEYGDEEVAVRIYQESIEHLLGAAHLVLDSTVGSVEENGRKALDFISRL